MDNERAFLFTCDANGKIKKASVGLSRALGYDSPDSLTDTGAWDCLSPTERARVIAWAQMPDGCIRYKRTGVGQVCVSAMKINDDILFVIEQPIYSDKQLTSVSKDLGLQLDTNIFVIQVDSRLRVKYWNSAAANMMEIEKKHAIGKLLVDLPDRGCKRSLCSMLKVS